jgi:predicted nucleotidyltransferase component of viral defense system
MISANEIRRIAAKSGVRDVRKVEIDILLTFLLQLFHERGVLKHLAFKGGTMLRKMVFGPRGRLSTDLDFTVTSDLSRDDFTLALIESLGEPYRGLTFEVGDRKDWYLGENGCGATPLVCHAENSAGVRVKLEVSMRERPVLPVILQPQIHHDYFAQLDFHPAAVPCLAFEEILAEKLRAASQRSKIRDLHDLAESADRSFDRSLVRGVTVLKLWNQRESLDYSRIVEHIRHHADYDLGDLTALLRKDQRPDPNRLIERVVSGYRFLVNLTELERLVTADIAGRRQDLASRLGIELRTREASPSYGSS